MMSNFLVIDLLLQSNKTLFNAKKALLSIKIWNFYGFLIRLKVIYKTYKLLFFNFTEQ